MQWVRFAASALFMFGGISAFVIGTLGIYKFKFVLNRMHSAAILDAMGLFFVVISLVIANGFATNSIKLISIVVFLWITSPVASHLIAKMEYFTDKNLDKEITNDIGDVKDGDDSEYSDL